MRKMKHMSISYFLIYIRKKTQKKKIAGNMNWHFTEKELQTASESTER